MMEDSTIRAEDFGALADELLDRVARGGPVQITRDGKPVAEITTVSLRLPRISAVEFRELMDRVAANRVAANREEPRKRGLKYSHSELRAFRATPS